MLQALLEGIQKRQVQWRALPLVLQRLVMVAMKALAQEGLAPFALSFQGLIHSYLHAHDPRSSVTLTGLPHRKILLV